MRAITKGVEPTSLTAHRLRGGNYDDYADKGVLRLSLAQEQRRLCCYCMSRIDEATLKIEHWRCQSQYRTEQLDYGNLLGACRGGEGNPPHLQHCDTRKENQDLRWNPAEPTHDIETRLRYELDGSIRSDDTEFDGQLTQVLNLNLNLLKTQRKGVLDAVLKWWKLQGERLEGVVSVERIERERDRWTQRTGDLIPYSQVAVWWLTQGLRSRGEPTRG